MNNKIMLNATQVDFKQIEVKPNSIIALQLPTGDYDMAQALGESIETAFGEIPFILFVVDSLDNLQDLPDESMNERGWQRIEETDSWFEKFMRRFGWVKVKE